VSLKSAEGTARSRRVWGAHRRRKTHERIRLADRDADDPVTYLRMGRSIKLGFSRDGHCVRPFLNSKEYKVLVTNYKRCWYKHGFIMDAIVKDSIQSWWSFHYETT
jgi:hypothetical protein